ncbi:MAG: transposase [Chloroflexi bacterium]|nr:transposase [Chloroflexota bacterium]
MVGPSPVGQATGTEYVYGYKLHLIVDCESEMPIGANVSAGNVHDVTRASNTLQQCRVSCGKFHPRYLMADAGYSAKHLFRLIKRQYRAIPVIQIPKRQPNMRARYGDILDTPEGKALAKQRQAVERAFSRLKGQRSLNSVTTRGLRKVTLHCYLSLIAMQSSAVG